MAVDAPAPLSIATENVESLSKVVKASYSACAVALSTAFFLDGRLMVTTRTGRYVCAGSVGKRPVDDGPWHYFIDVYCAHDVF